MDLFEFILIVTSVIYALALAQILSGISRLAQSNAAIRWSAPHALWIVTVFLNIFTVWWAGWEFRSVAWTFPTFLYMVIVPTAIYFSCALLLPQSADAAEIDLEAHFYRVRKVFLLVIFIAFFTAIIDGIVLVNESLWFRGRIGHIVMLVAVLTGLISANKRLQLIVAFAVLFALLYVLAVRLWIPR